MSLTCCGRLLIGQAEKRRNSIHYCKPIKLHPQFPTSSELHLQTMPRIEVLPNSSIAVAPGWAYVPDTGYDPSKAPLNPAARKRNARNVAAAAGGERSVRQQNAIQRRLAELDKDSHKDIQIPAPKVKEAARGKPLSAAQLLGISADHVDVDVGARGKTTAAVKKILQSQKTFANHLSDEEAMLALQASHSDSSHHSRVRAEPPTKIAKTPASKTKRASLGRLATSNLASKSTPADTPHPAREPPEPIPVSPATTSPQTPAQTDTPLAMAPPPPHPQLQPESGADDDPLLAISVPAAPSEEEIEALLGAPPLSYSTARATPPDSSGPPQRYFCELCGYWGRVRCLKCGARVCGLECKNVHDNGCSRMFA